jgi:hypothetical protein
MGADNQLSARLACARSAPALVVVNLCTLSAIGFLLQLRHTVRCSTTRRQTRMQAIAAWVTRVRGQASELTGMFLRVVVPGLRPIAIDNCFLGAQPLGSVPAVLARSSPESLSQLRILESRSYAGNLHAQRQLVTELSGLLSLALDRRVEIHQEFSVNVPQLNRIIFMPYDQAVDRTVLGPLPGAECSKIEDLLSLTAGLREPHSVVIGAAVTLFHGALLLFDRDLRAAYALLVAGLEILSREYGTPPSDWLAWDAAANWDEFIREMALTAEQAASLRERLMRDRQLRLKATFRTYAANRLPDSFWSEPWVEWMYGVNANEGRWTEPTQLPSRTVCDFLPRDRSMLAQALGHTYDTRSGIVHRGDLISVFETVTPASGELPADKPLPFAVLRATLAALIKLEVATHATSPGLPEVRIVVESDASSQDGSETDSSGDS